MRFTYRLLLFCSSFLLLVGCAQSAPQAAETPAVPTSSSEEGVTPANGDTEPSADEGYPAPATTVSGADSSGYPAPESQPTPVPMTMEEAYPIALDEARTNWNENAVFFGIMPSFQMQQNLNLPLAPGGWFFKFGLTDDLEEYFVAILDGRVNGTTIAEPVLIEPLPYTQDPIDPAALEITSEEFQQALFESEAGQAYREDELTLDYGLVDLDSTPNPVWSAFDRATGEDLFHMDAVTGEPVEAPFARYTPASE